MVKRRAASAGGAEDVVGSAFSELQENWRVLGGREEQQRWQMQETEREAQKWAVRWNLFRGLLGKRRRRNGCDMRRTRDVQLPRARKGLCWLEAEEKWERFHWFCFALEQMLWLCLCWCGGVMLMEVWE